MEKWNRAISRFSSKAGYLSMWQYVRWLYGDDYDSARGQTAICYETINARQSFFDRQQEFTGWINLERRAHFVVRKNFLAILESLDDLDWSGEHD